MLAAALGFGVLLWALVYAAGCESGGGVFYNNKTDEKLFAELDHRTPYELPADKRTGVAYVGILPDKQVALTIMDVNGCVIFARAEPFREFDKSDVVIGPRDLPSSDQRTDCDANRLTGSDHD
jgi:hypothetical protein